MPHLNAIHEAYSQMGVTVIGVMDASDKEAMAYIKWKNIRFPCVANVGKIQQAIEDDFGIETYPTTYVSARSAQRCTDPECQGPECRVNQALDMGNKHTVMWNERYEVVGTNAEILTKVMEGILDENSGLHKRLSEDKLAQSAELFNKGFYYDSYKKLEIAARYKDAPDNEAGMKAADQLAALKADKEMMTKVAQDLKTSVCRRLMAKANYLFLSDRGEEARPIFERIVEKYPGTVEAEEAQTNLNKLTTQVGK